VLRDKIAGYFLIFRRWGAGLGEGRNAEAARPLYRAFSRKLPTDGNNMGWDAIRSMGHAT
jgi:hypothetical protein